MNTRLTIIGGGVMGETMTASLVHSHTLPASNITIIDLSKERLAELRRHYAVNTNDQVTKATHAADVVILAVKPQQSRPAMEALRKHLKASTLVISIMAGVSLKTMNAALGHKRIIRSMPNTPAQLQEGMTVWIATRQVTRAQKKVAEKIFSSFGKQLEVKKENLINVATAISGSGPAYLFAFAEYFIAAGCRLGLSKHQATTLVKQTLRGSSLLLDHSNDDAATLREKVTSKKGTTDAALKIFRRERIDARISRAVTAAYNRAKELSKLF